MACPRFRRAAEHLHDLGPRVVGEFLSELAEDVDCQSTTLEKLDRYRRLTREMVRAVDAEQMPAPPLQIVGGA